jgi:hypothetical protein
MSVYAKFLFVLLFVLALTMILIRAAFGQGVTTAALSGIVTDGEGNPLLGANVVAVHEPSGTRYGASSRENGQYDIPNMRIGGPYSVTVSYVGYREQKKTDIFLGLGQLTRVSFEIEQEAVAGEEVVVTAEIDPLFNSGRTGAATQIDPDAVAMLPSVKRSTRDLIRLDPRSDGNYSFGGKNWLYNNISVDGSYFNNPFGLDDPAPGGQANAEPIPFDAVEQVQVSIAPFDVRQGGFTGAGVNTVTKSGTNTLRGSVYSYLRNENFQGNQVSGQDVIADPSLSYNQSGFYLSGPIMRNKLFFFANAELERRDDPGTNFVATTSSTGDPAFGESRVEVEDMNRIYNTLRSVYGYEPGAYQNFIHNTDNQKFITKLDWNINENHSAVFRYNYLDSYRDLPPHPFVLSFNGTGRGPNESSLPSQNSGYRIHNNLHSFALEVNSRGGKFANRFFASYNRFRDYREAFSEDFPTIEIGDGGVTYTTVGHEPFSIHNILDQDVLQITNNFSYYLGNHVITAGVNFEYFAFFNSFNIFRHGVFFLPYFVRPIGSTFPTLEDFFRSTNPADTANFIDFRQMVGSGPFKGELIDVGQLGLYAQDEFLVSPKLSLTYGLRIDFPIYFTDPVDNPFSRSLTALDQDGNPETVDQSKLPDTKPLFSPRVGFNWDVTGNRATQLRGGTGIFTGRIPFVWFGNVISNPGANPNLYPGIALEDVPDDHETDTGEGRVTPGRSILQQSFDLNGMNPEFAWPQVWNTNLAVDQRLPNGWSGTLELIYGKDMNAIYMRNADLVRPVSTLPDGRPYYGGAGNNELNPDGGSGIYVIDNTSDGYHFNLTAQLRKQFQSGFSGSAAYAYMIAKSQLKSTEIASVLWQENPIQGDPNRPNLSYSEFGQRHRITGGATYTKNWTPNTRTHFGLFFEIAEGNRFSGAGGNRYSYTYSGDVNGDGAAGNDLIYIPRNDSEIYFDPITDGQGNVVKSEAQQWTELNAFIEQDNYLSKHRGEIAERFGAVNPWYQTVDFRIMQDFAFDMGAQKHTFQLSLDFLNFLNLFSSSWGVRKVASSAATTPLALTRHDDDPANNIPDGAPVFNYVGPRETFIDDPGIASRWRIQLGLRYFFN